MTRTKRFTFLCSDDERAIIEVLANRLRRSQSDAVRWLIQEAARNAVRGAENSTDTGADISPEAADGSIIV